MDTETRFLALVRDGAAFDFTAISVPSAELLAAARACLDGGEPTSMILAAAGDSDPAETALAILTQADNAQASLAAALPEDVTLVPIDRGFDPQSETVDLASGKIVPDLTLAVAAAHVRIDAEYESRLSVTGPAKAAEHAAKLAEARAFIAGAEPGPMLVAEAKSSGVAVKDLAQAVISKADQAVERLATFASARRDAKMHAAKAASAEDCRAAVDRFIEFMSGAA